MEKQEFLEKIDELKDKVNDLIDERAQKLIESGAVDFEGYENDFRLPMYFMVAMGAEIKTQFQPPRIDYKTSKEIRNIYLNI